MRTRQIRNRKRFFRKLGAMLFWMNIMALFLVAWTVNCETHSHSYPAYPKGALEPILDQDVLTDNDYQYLFRQTGLASMVIDKLRRQSREAEIYQAQEEYFCQIRVRCEPNTVISREEFIVNEQGEAAAGMHIVDVEDGDILITYCSHVMGWRNGHAALVVDAEKGITLEAQVLGEPSVLLSLDRWERYPSYLILRLTDASPQLRSQVAQYAKEHLVGIPYQLRAGILESVRSWPQRNVTVSSGDFADSKDSEAPEAMPTGTQCAHLVWYAYAQFGYDLDSDGGFVVTPDDLANSSLLEVVQSYGMQIE